MLQVSILLLTLAFISPQAEAQACPHMIFWKEQSYCYQYQWLPAWRKDPAGQWIPSQHPSPQEIPHRSHPQTWLYSNLQIRFWRAEDPGKNGLELEDLQIFPYMYMDSGHHHGAYHEIFFDIESQSYQINEIRFHEMRGCWMIRYNPSQDRQGLENSQLLLPVYRFENLSDADNQAREQICSRIN